MIKKIPILLSFYSLSNGTAALMFGQLTYTPIRDLSFIAYGRRKTFRTLFRLYHTRPYSNQEIILVFDKGEVRTKTNSSGAFYEKKLEIDLNGAVLLKVLLPNGTEVKLVDGLYGRVVHQVYADTIVVSDIDDTLLHSFIYKKLLKFRTLMFTSVEKRKAVDNMQELIKNFTASGAASFYLSNSEQNLYPLIYRFLLHNNFPPGPLFLKHLRSLWDVIWNIKFPVKNTHKMNTLEDLLALFPDKKFVLMGDNTQHDLSIYLSVAEKYASSIRYIIIRKVVERHSDIKMIEHASETLRRNNIQLYYESTFPSSFE